MSHIRTRVRCCSIVCLYSTLYMKCILCTVLYYKRKRKQKQKNKVTFPRAGVLYKKATVIGAKKKKKKAQAFI